MYLVYDLLCFLFFFFFKQKTAYEMRISDWSSDVCSSDLSGLSVSGSLMTMSKRKRVGRSRVDPMIMSFTEYRHWIFSSREAYVRRCFMASRMAVLLRSSASTKVREV